MPPRPRARPVVIRGTNTRRGGCVGICRTRRAGTLRRGVTVLTGVRTRPLSALAALRRRRACVIARLSNGIAKRTLERSFASAVRRWRSRLGKIIPRSISSSFLRRLRPTVVPPSHPFNDVPSLYVIFGTLSTLLPESVPFHCDIHSDSQGHPCVKEYRGVQLVQAAEPSHRTAFAVRPTTTRILIRHESPASRKPPEASPDRSPDRLRRLLTADGRDSPIRHLATNDSQSGHGDSRMRHSQKLHASPGSVSDPDSR